MERNSRTSLYEKLYNEIKQEIICGKLKEGVKLPSKRAQAERLGISVVTVENAYAQLLAEGYIAARERSGYYVCTAEFPKPPKLPHKLKMTSVKKQPQNLRSSLEMSCSHFQYGRA